MRKWLNKTQFEKFNIFDFFNKGENFVEKQMLPCLS